MTDLFEVGEYVYPAVPPTINEELPEFYAELSFGPIRGVIVENFLAIREHIEPEVVSD